MKISVTGPLGNVGKALVERGATPIYSDIRDIDGIRREVEKISPDIIINAASKSSPDWCEENSDEAYEVNTFGISHLHEAVPDIPIVALSTDHVFAGSRSFVWGVGTTKPGPYKEDDRVWPVNYYGLTKVGMEVVADSLAGDVKIVRTSNLFWDKDPRVMWYIDALYKAEKVPVPTFQKRSFMHIEHFAESIEAYCERFTEMPKVLHISGSKTVDWYTFIKEFANEKFIPEYMQNKFTKKRFDDKRKAERPKSAGLNVELSAKLGLPQYDYLDGMELL